MTPDMGLVTAFVLSFRLKAQSAAGQSHKHPQLESRPTRCWWVLALAYREFLLGTSTLPHELLCWSTLLVFYFLLFFLGGSVFMFFLSIFVMWLFWRAIGVGNPRSTFEVKCNLLPKRHEDVELILVFTVHSLNSSSIFMTIYCRSAIILSPRLSPRG